MVVAKNQNQEKVVKKSVSRVRSGKSCEVTKDVVAIEEPLEIRAAGDTIAITMRTPGDDDRLALGFLYAEGILTSIKEVGRVFHCGRPGTEGFGNAIEVLPAPGSVLDIEQISTSRRGTLTTSACGVCGRQSVADLLEKCEVLSSGSPVPSLTVTEAVRCLRAGQPTYSSTGGTHAAGIFTSSGELLACHEDVGRHNAVDKAIGALLFEGTLEKDQNQLAEKLCILAVTGRLSFEIVQKAAMAQIPVVAGVSAPSSLAVDLASSLGMTLIGFARGENFNIYSHSDRIIGIAK